MVSEFRFIPTGYLGTEQAAVLLAELVAPANWQDETFLPGEHTLWNELGHKLSAEFIERSLIELREKAKEGNLDFSPVRTRWVDFDVAMRQLLKSLFAGEITAKCCDPDGMMHSIKKEFWGGVHGVDSLLRGLIQTTYPRAVILIEVIAIETLAANIIRLTAPQQISKNDVEEKCLLWLLRQLNTDKTNLRKGHYQNIALSKFGISRRAFRDRIWPRAVAHPSQAWRTKAGAKPKSGRAESAC
jgi:hypothetical protein